MLGGAGDRAGMGTAWSLLLGANLTWNWNQHHHRQNEKYFLYFEICKGSFVLASLPFSSAGDGARGLLPPRQVLYC